MRAGVPAALIPSCPHPLVCVCMLAKKDDWLQLGPVNTGHFELTAPCVHRWLHTHWMYWNHRHVACVAPHLARASVPHWLLCSHHLSSGLEDKPEHRSWPVHMHRPGAAGFLHFCWDPALCSRHFYLCSLLGDTYDMHFFLLSSCLVLMTCSPCSSLMVLSGTLSSQAQVHCFPHKSA